MSRSCMEVGEDVVVGRAIKTNEDVCDVVECLRGS